MLKNIILLVFLVGSGISQAASNEKVKDVINEYRSNADKIRFRLDKIQKSAHEKCFKKAPSTLSELEYLVKEFRELQKISEKNTALLEKLKIHLDQEKDKDKAESLNSLYVVASAVTASDAGPKFWRA